MTQSDGGGRTGHTPIPVFDVVGMQNTPPQGTPSPESYLRAIIKDSVQEGAEKAIREFNGNQRKWLGIDGAGWTKLLMPFVILGLVGVATWLFTIRDDIKARTTVGGVNEQIRESAVHHANDATAHPPMQKRLEAIEKEQRTIRESQIEQVATDKEQTKVLTEIKEDLKRLRYSYSKRNSQDE